MVKTRPLEISLVRIGQLFNSLDPSPFYERDLDADAEEYLVSWAQEYSHNEPLALTIHLREKPSEPDYGTHISGAIASHFNARAQFAQLEFRRMLRNGRASLLVGLLFMTALIGFAQWLGLHSRGMPAQMLRESFTVAGWVAMWKPMQIFLYDWWPLRGRIRLFRRLSAMPIFVNLVKAVD